MADDTTVPDPAVILDLMEAFRRSKTMFAAVSLGVFDALADGAGRGPDGTGSLTPGVRALADLAKQLAADPGALEQLLNACVALQLLVKHAGGYANTPAAAAYLCQRSPRRLTGYLGFSNTVMWQLWSHLEDAVREGTHRWAQTYGGDGPIFDQFFRTPDAKREFLWGMHGYGLISSPHVVNAFDLGKYSRLVDLGGATGHLAIAACERYPALEGVVFDLPAACPLAREVVGASRVAERLTVVEGDFFTDPLPPGDLYAVGRILHDWTEAKIRTLLARIYERLPAGGGLLIAEKLLNDDKTGPRWALMQSLNMLTCTEGRERTLGEYEALLVAAGFEQVRGCRTSSPLDAVLAVKAG